MTYALVIFINGAMSVMGVYANESECRVAKMDQQVMGIEAQCIPAN